MKIYKAIPLFITLFLGADNLKAQSVQVDSLKTYELDEIVIEENSEKKEEIEKLELKKTGLTNSIYFGDPIRALRSNSFVQTFSPLVSTFFIDGLPINEFGGFYIENIAILGSPWEQEWESISLSTKLSSKLFSNLSVSNNNYSAKYDALLGLVKVDLKDIDEKNFGFEGSTTLFNRYATANLNLPEGISSISVYVDDKKPIWPLTRIPETRFIPHTNSLQSLVKFFNGDLNLAFFKFFQNNGLNEKNGNDNLILDQDSYHDLTILTYNKDLFDYNLNLNLGYEYWNQNSDLTINNFNGKVDLGTRAYTVNFEAKEKNTTNTLGVNFSSIKYNNLNDLFKNDYVDSLFYEALYYISDDIPLELRNRIISEYEKIPLEERLSKLTSIVNMTAEWYNNSTGKDPEDYEWFIDYKNRLSNPFNGKIENSYIKSVDLIKVYWDNSYFIKNLLENDILLKTSVAVNKFKSQYSLLYAAGLVYLKDDLELTLGHSHQVSYFERGNISKIFQDRIDKRKSNSYSATTKFNFNNEFLDYLILESYFKEYRTNEYGKTYGINFLLNKDDKFSYRLSSSIGKSEFKNLPLIRSVDKTFTLLTSYEITDSWTTFLKFGIQDGYWTDKSISGRPEKLGTSKSIDVGMIKTFDIIHKGDVSIAGGAYFPLRSPLFTYLDSKNEPNITYAPTTFTLQLTINY